MGNVLLLIYDIVKVWKHCIEETITGVLKSKEAEPLR